MFCYAVMLWGVWCCELMFDAFPIQPLNECTSHVLAPTVATKDFDVMTSLSFLGQDVGLQVTCDIRLCCKPWTETFRDLSSMKVMKYSKPSCDRVGSLPHTSVKMCPRMESAQESVSFRMIACICLPLRQGSQWEVYESPAIISIPWTMPRLTIHRTAFSLRCPRWRCHI